jgi:para-aminobenzoate synthetase/4-amino-4-deoxychorismate lyase
VRARFDFGRNQGVPPVLFRSPDRIVIARSVDDVLRAMEEVEQGLREGLHAAGWVSYEAAPAFDRALRTQPPSDVPLVCFGLFRTAEPAPPLAVEGTPAPMHWTTELAADAYARGVAAVREAIAAGDTYQINYTFRLRAELAGEDLYGPLAVASEVPYAACIEALDWKVLSVSPELFFERDGNRLITRPMKGTAPRGRWAAEDAARREALAASEKNRAENVMIVDLCRNDLSRVCDIGSVRATSLFDVEAYPTVWQLVSTVEGDTREGTRLTDVFAALFPAGSITGAPKSSSMRLIAHLEHAPRGVYCGAIGYASPDGRAVFNVAIRTITVHTPTGRAEYGVGGGITWDSNSADEHAEALSKAAVLDATPPFRLIETLRSEGGRLIRLERHLDRLRESASWFGFRCDPVRVRALVEAHASSFGLETRRIRLLLNRDGHAAVQSEALMPHPPGEPPIALATGPVDSRDQFLCHKTTRREVYERHGAEHPGMFDVLLWNERRELTECTRANVVVELDGVRWTPVRTSGLLAGVFRGELLEAGVIQERVLRLDDLARATRLWCINSLREWVQVQLSRRPDP